MQLTRPSGAQGQLPFPYTSGGRERYSLLYRHTGKTLVAHRHAHEQGITGSSPYLREGTNTVTPQSISMKWPFLRAQTQQLDGISCSENFHQFEPSSNDPRDSPDADHQLNLTYKYVLMDPAYEPSVLSVLNY